MNAGAPDPKDGARIKDPDLLAILKFEYDACEVTGEACSPHLHHVVFKSQGGDDVRANIVGLAGDLHERYHRGDETVRNDLAWHVYHHRPDTQAYLNHKLEPGGFRLWFESHTSQLSLEEAFG